MIRVGVQLPEVERVVRWIEYSHMARLAEDVGFHSLWVGDHLLYRKKGDAPTGPWEAWSVMAALAAVTEKIQIGPLVASTSFHAPAMIAKKAITLDEISKGRFILGLGAGWNKAEYLGFGFPYSHRVSRFEEAFTIIRQLVCGEVVDFNGKYYHIEQCQMLPLGPRRQGPPLMIGSSGPRMLRITLPHVQMWNSWFTQFRNDPDQLGSLLDLVDKTCDEVGRDPKEIIKTVAVLVQLPQGTGRRHGDSDADAVTPISGTPEQVAEKLSRFEAKGIDHIQLVLDPIDANAIEWCGKVLEALNSNYS